MKLVPMKKPGPTAIDLLSQRNRSKKVTVKDIVDKIKNGIDARKKNIEQNDLVGKKMRGEPYLHLLKDMQPLVSHSSVSSAGLATRTSWSPTFLGLVRMSDGRLERHPSLKTSKTKNSSRFSATAA